VGMENGYYICTPQYGKFLEILREELEKKRFKNFEKKL